MLAKAEMERLLQMYLLFVEQEDLVVENFVNGIGKEHLEIVGPELILVIHSTNSVWYSGQEKSD